MLVVCCKEPSTYKYALVTKLRTAVRVSVQINIIYRTHKGRKERI